jgi:2-dehydropantoate 2-reductase
LNVYVVGAGAVGRYLGESLAGMGATVAYAPRRIEDVVPVEVDLAIVAVKSYDTADAIETLTRALPANSDATILTPQNGVGNEERLAAAFGADRIVSAALTVPVALGDDGRVVASNRGGIALAPVGAIAHNWLVAAFERTAIPVRVGNDYRALKWSKLALNIIANASFELEVRAIRETRAVMAKLGIAAVDLPRYPVRALFGAISLPTAAARLVLARRIAGARGRKAPSLLLDLRAGRTRSEVDVLNGAVAAAGLTVDVATPVNTAFARVLEDIAATPQLWPTFRERPAALAAEVDADERRAAGPSRSA